jgi:hypothetical protein
MLDLGCCATENEVIQKGVRGKCGHKFKSDVI